MVKKLVAQPNKKEPFGKRLASLRKARGLTQAELAHKTGVTQRVITYYERETPFPPSSILPALAKALNTTTDNILGVDKKNGEQKGTIPPRLARKLESVYTFPKKDQKTLILFLEALEAKQKVNSK